MGYPIAPLNNPENIGLYAQAGARELYMGFYDPSWTAMFGPHCDINRMSGFGAEANACTLPELLQVIPRAKAAGCDFYVTFNAATYSAAMEPWLESYFWQLACDGADGVILGGPEFIDLAHSCGLKAVASTMCGIYNSQIAQLYIEWGADRLILPRDLSLEELCTIIGENPSVEYEVFLMRNGCVFSDSHCLGMHGHRRGALCGEMRQAGRAFTCKTGCTKKLWHTSDLRRDVYHQYACGLCALWDLEQAANIAYKVVGRGDKPNAIAEDIALVAENIEIARRCTSRNEYLSQMRRNPYENQICAKGLNCYYPELWDGRRIEPTTRTPSSVQMA